MEMKYFKVYGQKSPDGKVVLMAVVDEDVVGRNLPDQFELQAMKMPVTIYTGTYPNIRLNSDTVKDITPEVKGMGLAGVATHLKWYCVTREEKDDLGIGL